MIKAYTKDALRGGRLNTDEVVMVKLLVIQRWYGLSDAEPERQVDDRLSFQKFSIGAETRVNLIFYPTIECHQYFVG